MLVLSKFPDNDLFVVVNFVLSDAARSTTFFNSELPRSQNSYHDMRIVDFDAS